MRDPHAGILIGLPKPAPPCVMQSLDGGQVRFESVACAVMSQEVLQAIVQNVVANVVPNVVGALMGELERRGLIAPEVSRETSDA